MFSPNDQTELDVKDLEQKVIVDLVKTTRGINITYSDNTTKLLDIAGVVNQKPTISISSPTGSIVSSGNVTLSGTVLDPDTFGKITSLRYQLDGAGFSSFGTVGVNTINFNTVLTNVGPGNHTIIVEATDDEGGVTSATTNFTINVNPNSGGGGSGGGSGGEVGGASMTLTGPTLITEETNAIYTITNAMPNEPLNVEATAYDGANVIGTIPLAAIQAVSDGSASFNFVAHSPAKSYLLKVTGGQTGVIRTLNVQVGTQTWNPIFSLNKYSFAQTDTLVWSVANGKGNATFTIKLITGMRSVAFPTWGDLQTVTLAANGTAGHSEGFPADISGPYTFEIDFGSFGGKKSVQFTIVVNPPAVVYNPSFAVSKATYQAGERLVLTATGGRPNSSWTYTEIQGVTPGYTETRWLDASGNYYGYWDIPITHPTTHFKVSGNFGSDGGIKYVECDVVAAVVHGTQDFPTPGTYDIVVPNGVTSMMVRAVAGGGGGGGKGGDNYPAQHGQPGTDSYIVALTGANAGTELGRCLGGGGGQGGSEHAAGVGGSSLTSPGMNAVCSTGSIVPAYGGGKPQTLGYWIGADQIHGYGGDGETGGDDRDCRGGGGGGGSGQRIDGFIPTIPGQTLRLVVGSGGAPAVSAWPGVHAVQPQRGGDGRIYLEY